MDVDIKINNIKLDINTGKFYKMLFLFNALENGWTIKKKNKNYIFVKNHENKREVFDEKYLASFMKENTDITKLFI